MNMLQIAFFAAGEMKRRCTCFYIVMRFEGFGKRLCVGCNWIVGLKRWHGFWLIWYASLWVIWTVRNEIVFNNGTLEVDDVVERIKVLSWIWSLNRLKIGEFVL